MGSAGKRSSRATPTRWQLVPAVMLLVAAACGNDGTDDADDVNPVPSTTSESAEASEPNDRAQRDDPATRAPAPTTSVRRGPFVSRPDVPRPPMDITVSKSTAPGLLFLTPRVRGDGQRGTTLIIDNDGDIAFSRAHDLRVTDFRVQRYRGEPVLTWWEGEGIDGRGDGEYVVVDSSYEEVARFPAGNGLMGDMHEFRLTDEGTALILSYDPEPADLTPYGGRADGFIYEYYVQEIDVATGEVLLQWRMSDDVSPFETFSTLPGTDGDGSTRSPFDWAHVNSVAEDGDDALLVSARNTNAVYAIDRRSGELRWRLGGTQSDFEMGEGAGFSLQHDAQRQPDGTISIFDNVEPGTNESRALFLDVDEAEGTVTRVREVRHDAGIRAKTQGNAQLLPNGGVVIGWGSAGRVSEFSSEDELVFDASLAPGRAYRAYRFEWEGLPAEPPDLVVRSDGTGRMRLYMSWNGATEVTEWRILGGDDPENLEPMTTATKDGFETRTEVDAVGYVAVEALDQSGDVLGASQVQQAA